MMRRSCVEPGFATVGRHRANAARLAVWCVLLVFGLGLACAAQAAGALDEWRGEVARVRTLAENDAPRAYEQAQRLQAILPADATPADRARVLNLRARIETYLALTEQAANHIQLALGLATRHADRVGQAEADLNTALNAVNQGRIDALIAATTHSVAVLDGIDRPDLLGEALLRTAMMYRRLGKIEESVAMSMQAMEIARRSNDPLVRTYAYQGMAMSFEQSDHVKESHDNFVQMREQARAAGSKLLEAFALNGLGGTMTTLGDPRGGESAIREAISLYRAVGTPFGLGNGLHALAAHLRTQGRHAEALQAFNEGAAIFERHSNKIGLWYALISRSATYRALNNNAAALSDAERAYALATDIGLSVYLSESARRVAEIVAAAGDYRRAYELSAEAADTTANASREKIKARVVELAQSYETESKRREIDELTRRNEQQTAELKQRELQQRSLWTVLGSSVIALAGTAFFLLRLRRSHRLLEAVNTQLQCSQNELQHQTGILQSILDSMGEGVAVANEHGEWLLVNPAAEKIVGIGRAPEGSERSWIQRDRLYLPDRVTLYPSEEIPLARAIRGESCEGVEIFVLNPTLTEGRWLSVTAGPLTDKGGVVRGGVAVFSDVTARKCAEEEIHTLNASLEQRVQTRTGELRQQTRYLRALIDTLPWWVWFKDTESRYLAVNQAAADTCGLSADELVGKSDLDVLPRELAEAYRADDLHVMSTCSPKTVEEPQIIPEGVIWMETFKAPVLDEDGTVLGTVGFARNISERKAAEEAREAALVEAQRLARLRSDFLAQMSHELRTPLNGILGYAQILLRDKRLDERQLAGLNVIQQCGEHLLTLINDILDFAKIEAEKQELYPTDIVLSKFLRVIAEIIAVKAAEKLLEFSCVLAPELPEWVRVDEKRLRQVLLNLLCNAVKFTDCGKVSLYVRFSPPNRLRFEVQDTGIGIGEDQLDIIFQPFAQAGETQHRVAGTGLGLAISRQFVRLMGGDIHVASRVGRGSTFWFELTSPMVQAELAAVPVDGIVTGYEGARRKILVVDDVAENRAVVIDMLGQLGFEMSEAANGLDGLEKAQRLRPDLILMDVVMPEMDGLEATRRLRRLPQLEAVPIIAISASASGSDAQRNLAAGMDTFLPKPIDLGELLIQIAALLKLVWIYELPQTAPSVEAEPVEPPVALPAHEMEILHRLARMGNMRDILQQAAYLSELDERYRPFAKQLRMLANGYQSKAIMSLVERYLEKADDA